MFHGKAIKLNKFLVELEKSFPESVDYGLLIAEWNGDLLMIEASYIVTEWLPMMLLNVVTVSGELLATHKMFYEGVRELSK